jgi:bifunctional UDP-N-acetylglucosamine pyrophosphorylase / glucosamine-1-phosphate N-acetyltransferase
MHLSAVILAAGQGTRMRSALPKVLHRLLGRAMVWYSLETAQKVTGVKPVLVIGHGAEQIRQEIGEAADFVLQESQLGTGHAVLQAEPLLKDKGGVVIVTYADMPLLSDRTLKRMVEAHQTQPEPAITMLTLIDEEARGFGRVLRNAAGQVESVVEEAEATPDQLSIRELNAGVYCFTAGWLWPALSRISISSKGEYFLTDLVAIAAAEGLPVQSISTDNPGEALGINNRIHLAEAEAILRQRTNEAWMLSGVTLIDPLSTYIETGVEIGPDTIIYPNTYLQGGTKIGQACTIGPNSTLRDTRVGDRCTVFASVAEKAVLEDDVDIGPYAHLRKGAHLARGVHMGNFGEVKNSYLGPGTKMGHFSYVGDTTTGEKVNIGAGTITCNYDGEKKSHTEIGAGAFIGSATMLVAPVELGEGARTGAGAVVTKDVPSYTLAVGVPARAIRKLKRSG